MKRTCPECGRTVETRVNRFKVECWPPHNLARLSGQRQAEVNRILASNRTRQPDYHDWEIQCPRSGCPVD